jgi:protein-arginine kinase
MARRNFKEYPFVPMMSTEMKLSIERKVQETLGNLYGKYYSLNKLDGKVKEYLSNIGVSVERNPSHDAAGINDDWPVGRGVFIDENYSFALLVNFEDHIQVISSTEKADISKPLQSISKVLTKFSKMIFSQDSALGYLTASP